MMNAERHAIIGRRLKTVPTMLAVTAIALFGFPFIAPLAAISDLARLRFKLPKLRVYLFTLQYLVNDSAEIVAAPFLWLGRAPVETYDRIQMLSADVLVKRADQLLGVRLDLAANALAQIAPGPVIVIARHVSVFDSTLPPLICNTAGLTTRGVIMADMLADPGFDLIYGRLGWKFIQRDDGPGALAQISELASMADESTALLIFPEGRVFSPSVLERTMERLVEKSPERAARLAGLERSLPPRPGGVIGLLAAVPEADVVLISHEGLDNFEGLADLATKVPLNSNVVVSARRIARSEIPTRPAEQVEWLDELWLAQDNEIGRSVSKQV